MLPRSARGSICSTGEKNRRFVRQDHDIASTAYTRAANRAISDMIGAGEISAEEVRATGEFAGISLEERGAIKEAWATAPQERRTAAVAWLRSAGFNGDTTSALFGNFARKASDVQVAELVGQLSGVASDFDPDAIQIVDDELRRRCSDLLAADAHFDRAIRESCVVLEDRVRKAIRADATLTAVPLMERAFGTSGLLKLSEIEQEQIGAMQVYRGMMAFFRNSAGHHLADHYTREDALRFVLWIDQLLGLVQVAAQPRAST